MPIFVVKMGNMTSTISVASLQVLQSCFHLQPLVLKQKKQVAVIVVASETQLKMARLDDLKDLHS